MNHIMMSMERSMPLDGLKFLDQMFDTSKTDFIQMDSIWMDHKFCTSTKFTFSTFIKPFHVI